MTEPTIADRADKLAAQLQGVVDALPTYSSARPSLTVRAGLALAQMVADLARLIEKPTASSALVKHQGPFFNGTEMRCGCGELVQDAEYWAAHAVKQIGGHDE